MGGIKSQLLGGVRIELAVGSITQWDLLSYVAKMVSIVVLCTHRQTVLEIPKCHLSLCIMKDG